MDIPGKNHPGHTKSPANPGKCCLVLLPTLTHRSECIQDSHCDLMALPVCFVRLGISDPSQQSSINNGMSEKITASLVALVLQQSHQYSFNDKNTQLRAKRNARATRRKNATSELNTKLQKKMTVFSEECFKLANNITH